MTMIICVVFVTNILSFVLCSAYTNVSNPRNDRESSEDDMKIENIMTTLLGICIHDNPDQTIKQLRKDTQTILKNIGIYKEVVKLNKQLRSEISWIIEESKGPRERKRIIDLLKQDVKGTCAAEKYNDCTMLKTKSNRKTESGVYTIYPDGKKPVQAYCDMSTNGGGWTVIHKRFDGSVDFKRKWLECEKGFGNINGEFWFGNHFVHTLTASGKYELRIDMIISNTKKYAIYKRFSIGDAASKYKLLVEGYSGNAGDSFTSHNGSLFSAKDQDNDKWPKNCASVYEGPWWHTNCYNANLNRPFGKMYWGIYFSGPVTMMIRKI